MKKIAIVVGHTPDDGGAYNSTHKINEFSFNNRLAPLVAARLRLLGHLPIIVYRNTYSLLPKDVNATGADVCLSLHCNAFNGLPNGCEVLYFAGSAKSKALAESVLPKLCEVMGNKNRGVRAVSYDYKGTKGDRGGWLLQKTSMPAIIGEPFFIDSDESIAHALANIDALAEAYALGVHNYIK